MDPLKLDLFYPYFHKMQFQENNCLNKSFRPNHKLEQKVKYKLLDILVFFLLKKKKNNNREDARLASLNSLIINNQMLFVFSLITFAGNIPKEVKYECNYDTETNQE